MRLRQVAHDALNGALPLAADVRLDARVLAIAAGVTLAAALTAGLPLVRRVSSRWRPGLA
jgi:hypothetical protein